MKLYHITIIAREADQCWRQAASAIKSEQCACLTAYHHSPLYICPGALARYWPDFFVKTEDGRIFIVETKGVEDEAALLKKKRLEKWCEDANEAVGKPQYAALYVLQDQFRHRKQRYATFKSLVKALGGPPDQKPLG